MNTLDPNNITVACQVIAALAIPAAIIRGLFEIKTLKAETEEIESSY